MIIPDHFSESLATVFLGEIYLSSLTQTRIRDPNLLTIDPGTEMEKFKSRIWARRPGSTTLIFGIVYGSIRSRTVFIQVLIHYAQNLTNPMDPGQCQKPVL